ncbi:MAG: M3 family oligoendopeptidase [bacterium]
MEQGPKAAGVRWEISDLYDGTIDARVAADLETSLQKAEQFQARFYGNLAQGDLSHDTLLAAIVQLEEIYTFAMRPEIYAFLAFSANTADDDFKALYAKCQEVMARVQNLVLFFELEVQKIAPEKFAQFFGEEEIDRYRHYLEGVRLFQPFSLSEKEEQVINRKDLTGKNAFVSLFDEYTSSFAWQLEVDGAIQTLTGEEMRNLLRRPEPKLRERAKRAYDGRYGENAIIFCNVVNAIVKDHALEMEMRGYGSPITPSHLRNRIAPEIVETMMEVTAAHNHLAQAYFVLKAKLINIPKLRGCDLLAPISDRREHIPFAEGLRLVREAFASFSPEMAGLAQKMFDNKWIDAEVRRYKRGGAYCHGALPGHHPYILMSYNDDIDNVYTLAHELGHALHDFYAGRKQTLFNYHPPLVAAETASVFAEMLLTRKLMQEVADRELRTAILTGVLEDCFATIHTQNYYTLFELEAHRAGARQRLSAEQLCEIWTRQRTAMYGATVDFLPEQKWYWAAIPHFIHTRFYCYAYTFGALLVLSLFRRYEEEGDSFVPRYLRLLEAGGSQAPEDLTRQMGFDLRQPAFWEGGFAVIEQLLDDLREVAQ